jgi:hypothetical protein
MVGFLEVFNQDRGIDEQHRNPLIDGSDSQTDGQRGSFPLREARETPRSQRSLRTSGLSDPRSQFGQPEVETQNQTHRGVSGERELGMLCPCPDRRSHLAVLFLLDQVSYRLKGAQALLHCAFERCFKERTHRHRLQVLQVLMHPFQKKYRHASPSS